jgi:adenylate kinase
LVPDEIVLDMVRQALVAAAATGGGYALDGIPRNMRQACATYLIARELGMTTNVGLRLQVEGGELVRRLLARAGLGGSRRRYRGGHPPTTQLYHQVTYPIVGWYAERGILVSVDVMRPPEQVGREILAALEVMRPLVDHVSGETRRAVDLTSLGVAFGATPPASDSSG